MSSEMWPAWVRWLGVPWSERTLLAAVIVAAAAPSLLVASADLWLSAAQDEVTALVVADAPLADNGVDVEVETRFDGDATEDADTEVAEGLHRVSDIGPTKRTLYTLPGLMEVGSPRRTVGPVGRILARDGALDAVEVTAQLPNTDGGVWITTWFADRHGLELGDGLGFEAGVIADEQWNDLVPGGGANSVFRIVGLYEPLWTEQPGRDLDPYWDDVPQELVPTYIDAFRGPNAELVLTDETTLFGSGLTGVARWTAPMDRFPLRYEGLRTVREEVRRFDAALVGPGALGDSMLALAVGSGRRPVLTTAMYTTTMTAISAADGLEPPLSAARLVGVVVASAGMVAVGLLFVERRRSEFRLLVSEGERPWRLAARVAAQLAGPVVLGVVVGAVGAAAVARWAGSARHFDLDRVSWEPMVWVGASMLALAAISAGWWAGRALRPIDRAATAVAGRVAAAAIVVSTVVMWVQVGGTAAAAEAPAAVDLAVVALPVLVVLSILALMMGGARWALQLIGRRSERLPTPIYLASRRLANVPAGLSSATALLGLGAGLVVFSTALTTTLDRTVELELSTEVGGESSVTLLDDLTDGLLEETTVVRTFDTVTTPGRSSVRLLAVDPDTFVSAVDWPPQFGSEAGTVLEQLGEGSGESLSVIAVRGQGIGTTGSFGLTRAIPYRIVGTVESMPGARANRPTLIALASSLDELALRRAGYESIEQAAPEYRPPTDGFGRMLVSQRPLPDVVTALDDAGIRFRDPISKTMRRRAPEIVAARSAFRYLGVLGGVAAAASLVAVSLHVSGQRRSRALMGVMTRAMGLGPNQAALVTVIEFGVMQCVAVGAGLIAAPVAVRRLSTRFDPSPQLPPDVPVTVSWAALCAASGAAVGMICLALWWSERRAALRPSGEVMRDAG